MCIKKMVDLRSCTKQHKQARMDFLTLNPLQLFPQCFSQPAIRNSDRQDKATRPRTPTKRALSHKINFNFHVFIRPEPTGLRPDRPEVERGRVPAAGATQREFGIDNISRLTVYVTVRIH